ncbi:MAG: PLP-dependent aspartate aminotransferase family protein [Spirochaetaceae bacterium]|jgi:cystathionine beta-lyase|nr:PLP-dependent aspartate aminotransferase family protein [Spirochaetaceae bacterium]
MKFGTLLIHNGHDTDPATGALGTPIYQTSTFDRSPQFAPSGLPALPALPAGRLDYDYARSGNPTRKALEDAVSLLEGGTAGFAFSSGIAAIAAVLGIFSTGDHIITAEDIYGGSYRLLNTYFKRWGLEHTALSEVTPDTIRAALRPSTKALFIETPSNPLLKITDIRASCAAAREAGLITIVDNTFMTPLLQRPLELGADVVAHSATKFLGGHSDVLAGIVVTKSSELGKRVYAVQNGLGATLGPWDCFLVLRGIKTLKARLEAQQKTAARLADFLSGHKNVATVYYPGLAAPHQKAVHDGQAEGPGAVLSFKTKTDEQALSFLGRTRLAAPAVSLGGVETIASYPIKMSHAAIPPLERERLGISASLIRISAGLEDADDLIEDFDAALS